MADEPAEPIEAGAEEGDAAGGAEKQSLMQRVLSVRAMAAERAQPLRGPKDLWQVPTLMVGVGAAHGWIDGMGAISTRTGLQGVAR